jgi:DNA-binding NtrC family response regulator
MADEVRTVNVLLVDDEADFLSATAKALTRRGFRVFTASGAEEARAVFRAQEIDVAVLDVNLPDGDGHQLFYELKRWRPEAQFLMLTGHGSLQRAFEMSREGVFDYLGKPMEMDVLAARIRDAASVSAEAEVPPDAIRVLLIDDEADFLVSIKRVLTRRGLVVAIAGNGEEGLALLARQPVDVAIVDVKMPGIDGLEVLARIKKTFPRVEVLLLTGHATVDTAIAGMKDGAFDYLFKPHDPDDLVRKIQAAAEQKREIEGRS